MKKAFLFGFLMVLVFCFGTAYSEDGAGGKWDWDKKQAKQLNIHKIKPPEGVGNYPLEIGQSGKTTQLIGDLIIQPDIVSLTGATTTLTSAYSGKILVQPASTDHEVDLPADPTGCDFVFVKNTGAQELRIDPNGTDQILGATNTAGDYYYSITAYSTIRLIGVSTSGWIVSGPTGAWSEQ